MDKNKEEKVKEDLVGVGSTGCSHSGFYSLAGMSSHRDESGDIVHFISLFCTNCGEMTIKLTKLEVGKTEESKVAEEVVGEKEDKVVN